MPFVLWGLGDLFYALFLFLVVSAIGTIIAYLNGLIPNPDILGVRPFGWFHDALGDIHKWAVATSDSAILRIRDTVVDVGHVLLSFLNAQASLYNHLYDLIAHVHNTSVPAAQTAAETYAAARVATAEADLAAAKATLQDELNTLQGYNSSVLDLLQAGGFPRSIGQSILNVESDLKTDAANLQANISANTTLINTDITNAWNAIAPLQTAVSSTIPAEFAQQAATEKADVTAASQQAQANLVSAAHVLQNELDGTQTEITTQQGLITTAQANISTLSVDTEQNAVAIQANEAAIVTANATITSLQNEADSTAKSLTEAQTQINTLAQTATITLPALPDITIPSEITVPLAVGALAGAVAGVITEFAECAVTTCGGPNNLQNLLQDLLGAADLVGIGAFLSEAISNPVGEAQSFATLAQGLYNDADSVFQTVLSL